MARKFPPGTTQQQVAALAKKYRWDPVGFCRRILRVDPDDWQREAFQGLLERRRLSVRSGHGVGKSAFESWAILWFLFTRPFPKIPVTAPTKDQLLDVLWPEIAKWMSRSKILSSFYEWTKTRVFLKDSPERWFATARTSNRPENMAGFHEDHILVVMDEASGIADEIYETIEGALTTRGAYLILCGNPTQLAGEFYRSHHQDRDSYHSMHVSCLDSPRVSPEYAARLARRYHEDSDVYRVRVLGEFPMAEPDTFIPLPLVQAAMERDQVPGDPADVQIGVDVARFGDDETVIAIRIGGEVLPLRTYSRQDTMTTAGHVLAEVRALLKGGAARVPIIIDDDGVGGGVTDRVREVAAEEGLPLDVRAAHNGSKAADPNNYFNWGTESWAWLRDLLQEGSLRLPTDDDLQGQLTTRKYEINSKGQIRLEGKDSMKKRGLASPDRADAVVLATVDHETTATLLSEDWNPALHIVQGGFPVPANWPRWISLHPSVHGEHGVIWLTCSPRGELYIYRELVQGGTIEALGESIRRLTGLEPIAQWIAPPSIFQANQVTGTSWADSFHQANLPVQPGAKDVPQGLWALRQALSLVRGTPTLRVFSACQGTIRQLSSLEPGQESEEDRFPLFAATWRVLLERPRWRDMEADMAFGALDYPEPDIV